MPLILTTKTVVRWGSVAAALTALGAFLLGAWGFARPYAFDAIAPGSEAPPLAGLARIKQDELEMAGLTQTDKQTQVYLKAMQQQVLFLDQQNWILAQSQAQAQLRQNPNNLAARQQLNTANQALYGIQRQLYGTP